MVLDQAPCASIRGQARGWTRTRSLSAPAHPPAAPAVAPRLARSPARHSCRRAPPRLARHSCRRAPPRLARPSCRSCKRASRSSACRRCCWSSRTRRWMCRWRSSCMRTRRRWGRARHACAADVPREARARGRYLRRRACLHAGAGAASAQLLRCLPRCVAGRSLPRPRAPPACPQELRSRLWMALLEHPELVHEYQVRLAVHHRVAPTASGCPAPPLPVQGPLNLLPCCCPAPQPPVCPPAPWQAIIWQSGRCSANLLLRRCWRQSCSSSGRSRWGAPRLGRLGTAPRLLRLRVPLGSSSSSRSHRERRQKGWMQRRRRRRRSSGWAGRTMRMLQQQSSRLSQRRRRSSRAPAAAVEMRASRTHPQTLPTCPAAMPPLGRRTASAQTTAAAAWAAQGPATRSVRSRTRTAGSW